VNATEIDWKAVAREVFRQTLGAIDIPLTLERKLRRHGSWVRVGDAQVNLAAYRRIVAVAFGKAAWAMAEGLSRVLAPDFRVEGILVVPASSSADVAAGAAAQGRELPGWRIFAAGHPVPTAESFAAGRAILELVAGCDDGALIFFLLSGGGSSLVELPLDGEVSLEDFQNLNRALVTCGASIGEINAVRKHLSAVKGGRLAGAACDAVKLTLAITDVPEGQESALASGPTLPDPTTVADAERVARQYHLLEKLPASLREKFEHHALMETPKAGDPAFERAFFKILLGAHDLLHNAHRSTEAHGCVSACDHSTDNWPIDKAADFLLGQLARLRKAYPSRHVAVLADGELSSPVTGKGVGGRNSAFVLACVERIARQPIVVLSAGTDGIDGNSPAAGAVADGETLAEAQAAGLDPQEFFQRSDAYTFFKRLGGAIETGPTGNNLRDLRLLVGFHCP
jgi:glycerate 2-kinase